MAGIILPYRGVLPALAPDVWVAPNAAVIGDVEIGAGSGVWFACTIRGDVNEIRIGRRVNIQDGTVIHVSKDGQGTYIGDDVTIGHGAVIHACTLGEGCFIGMQACIMDDAIVEPGAMVAAGALVTPGKHVLAGQLWTGRPARYARDLTEAEAAYIPRSAERYAALAAEYLAGDP